MKTVFADTGYYIALVNSEDEYHLLAREYTASFRGSFLTTSWVLLELANHLAKEPNRALFLSLFDDLRKNQRVRILPPAQAEFDRGIEPYRHRPDKDWSLTDCVSFVVMRDHGVNEALSTDRNFEQASLSRC